jgi:hypothetical protein
MTLYAYTKQQVFFIPSQHDLTCRDGWTDYRWSHTIRSKIWGLQGGDYDNGVFWDVTKCGSCKKRRVGGTKCLHHQADKNRWTRNNVSRNVASSAPILVTLMMEALRSSETSVLTRATWRNIPEEDILHTIQRLANLFTDIFQRYNCTVGSAFNNDPWRNIHF